MRYGPYTKQEFYSDVLAAWNDAKNETHSDVVNALLNDKYSWENLKHHYSSWGSEWRALYEYHDKFNGTSDIYSHVRLQCNSLTDTDAKDILSRIGRWCPAMQNKVTGAVKVMRANGIHLPPKASKPEVDFASLRCA
jgi:hypothetical protein